MENEGDINDEEYGGPPGGLQELNLDVSIQELHRAERAFTYADLYAIRLRG
jgi:hypothetical protein